MFSNLRNGSAESVFAIVGRGMVIFIIDNNHFLREPITICIIVCSDRWKFFRSSIIKVKLHCRQWYGDCS